MQGDDVEVVAVLWPRGVLSGDSQEAAQVCVVVPVSQRGQVDDDVGVGLVRGQVGDLEQLVVLRYRAAPLSAVCLGSDVWLVPDDPAVDLSGVRSDDAALRELLRVNAGFRTFADIENKSGFIYRADDVIEYDPTAVKKVLQKGDGAGFAMLEMLLPKLEGHQMIALNFS